MDSEVVAQTADRGTVTWTVTVKLTDVDELRRLATRAHPEEAALIADSLEVAWQNTADPFAPLRSIPRDHLAPGAGTSSIRARGRPGTAHTNDDRRAQDRLSPALL